MNWKTLTSTGIIAMTGNVRGPRLKIEAMVGAGGSALLRVHQGPQSRLTLTSSAKLAGG